MIIEGEELHFEEYVYRTMGVGQWQPLKGSFTGRVLKITDESVGYPRYEVVEDRKERCGFLWLFHKSVDYVRWIERERLRGVTVDDIGYEGLEKEFDKRKK